MKRPALSFLLFLLVNLVGTALAADPYMQTDPLLYPYAPSLLQWEKTDTDFVEPETCGACHPQKYREWQGSMHAIALKDPIYHGELNLAIQAIGPEAARVCLGCHTPIAVVTGEIKGPGLTKASSMALAGVSCDACHSIKGHTHWQTPSHQPENTSAILSPGTAAILTKYGPLKSGDGCGAGFHQCIESPLHTSTDLCASCHQVLNYKTHTPLGLTYQEWKSGAYSVANIHCQDCHMVEIDTFKQSADTFRKPTKGEYRHYFNGANFLLYELTRLAAEKSGDESLAAIALKKYTMAVERLQAATDLEIIPIFRDHRLAEIKVRVKNIRAGHNLPTSVTNLRQVWLEVTAIDAQNQTILSTGSLNAHGELSSDVRLLNTLGQDSSLCFAVDPWAVETFSKNDTVPPKGYRDIHYGLSVERGDPITIEVALRYRQVDPHVAKKILSNLPDKGHLERIYGITEIPQLPIIDMRRKTVVINKTH